jgi:putative ABC transport system ATP-binding protein
MLELCNVCKTFNIGTINEKKALCGINLNLREGDFVTVIGGNGAGKSTMLNAIAGVWPVDDGTISINGANVTALPEHKRASYIGRVFQDPMMGTAANMAIEENLAWPFAAAAAHPALGSYQSGTGALSGGAQNARSGLEGRMSVKVGLLSGGQRQALTLMMATLQKPKLLLLDEHTAALDPATALKVLELTDKVVAEHGLTALMITHNMTDAIRHGNRLLMMNSGKIILDISGEEKKKLKKADLLSKFAKVAGVQEDTDSVLLS